MLQERKDNIAQKTGTDKHSRWQMQDGDTEKNSRQGQKKPGYYSEQQPLDKFARADTLAASKQKKSETGDSCADQQAVTGGQPFRM